MENLVTVVASKAKTVEISRDHPTVIIGERINPTGRKKVLAALEPPTRKRWPPRYRCTRAKP